MTTQNPQPNNRDPRSDAPESNTSSVHPNTQLYEESTQKVQPMNDVKKDESVWGRVTNGIPKILWLPLLPFLLIAVIYLWLENLNPIPKKWRSSGLFGIIQIVVGAVLAAMFINAFIFQSYQVVGDSMLPTLHNGDRLIINKLGKTWSGVFGDGYVPKRGDIIIFDDPNGSSRQLVKRVIGLPGDTVDVSKGVITIYNDENPEGFNPDASYADSLTVDTNYTLRDQVEEGRLFVAGDNRIGGASFDSRNDLGQVPTENVIGDLILRLLPLSDSRFY